MHKKVKKHLEKQDPILFKILQRIGDIKDLSPRLPQEYFFCLCREIVSQQLSDKARDKIFARFLELFPNKKVTSKYLLKLSDQEIRSVGTSWAKVRYLKDLGQKVESKEILLEDLPKLDDKMVIAELTKIKGIGSWTAEMFLMFALGREDVFSSGDLGLRRAIEKIYNIPNLTKERIEKISLKWSPYRTWACRILWSYRDT